MRRRRLQSLQKAAVMLLTKDTLPRKPGTRKFLATSPRGSCPGPNFVLSRSSLQEGSADRCFSPLLRRSPPHGARTATQTQDPHSTVGTDVRFPTRGGERKKRSRRSDAVQQGGAHAVALLHVTVRGCLDPFCSRKPDLQPHEALRERRGDGLQHLRVRHHLGLRPHVAVKWHVLNEAHLQTENSNHSEIDPSAP